MTASSKRTGIFIALLCAVLLSACTMRTISLTAPDGSKEVTLTVEIADDPDERERGLMFRESLAPDTGMLFVFTEPQMLAFWMRDTLVPLTVLFFDGNGRFINSADMQPCVQEPCPTYKSVEAAQYALEVNRDFKSTHGIGVGWSLDIQQVARASRPR